jgi:hypothetical protein
MPVLQRPVANRPNGRAASAVFPAMTHTSQTAPETHGRADTHRDRDDERDPVLGLAIRCIERAALRSVRLDALCARILLAAHRPCEDTGSRGCETVNAASGDRGSRPGAI